MQRISLDDLPRYSSLPARIQGTDPFTPISKTPEKVYKEYNDDKYAKLLSAVTPEEALSRYWGSGEKEIAFSRHGELFVGTKKEARAWRESLFLESLRPLLARAACVVELGAGFGQMTHLIRGAYPDLPCLAGEFTPNGRALGERLFPSIKFIPFDFTSERWGIFDGVENALVLTVQAIEMLPDASLFVRRIRQHSDHVNAIVHFEPIYENDGSPLSLMRQRYITLNGYSENILQSIPKAKVERDFFGLNPLFPESRIEWKP